LSARPARPKSINSPDVGSGADAAVQPDAENVVAPKLAAIAGVIGSSEPAAFAVAEENWYQILLASVLSVYTKTMLYSADVEGRSIATLAKRPRALNELTVAFAKVVSIAPLSRAVVAAETSDDNIRYAIGDVPATDQTSLPFLTDAVVAPAIVHEHAAALTTAAVMATADSMSSFFILFSFFSLPDTRCVRPN